MSNATVDSDPGASDTDAAVLASLATTSPDDTAGAEDAVDDTPAPPSFADLDLPREVLSALEDMGYFTPTPVQTAVYQKVMDGKDAMVQSRTGTGKTTAFGLPIVSTVDASKRVPQALILTPTRELALQVSRELGMLAKQKGLAVETIYGGAPIGKQITALQAGVHIVAGTPGRVLDLIGRRVLDLKAVRFFVLDECDEMLSMGFLEDIEKISSYVPKDRQTLLFSATMPDEVKRYSKRQMREPEHIALSTGNISVEEIHHAYYIVSGVARARDLLRVLAKEQPESAIIFCNTRDETGMVARFLTKQGLDAEALSSDLSQSDRERVMKRMKDKNLRFLVATDVAARGIDIQELSHVINYSFPESAEVYVHRTGRTGRAGKKGVALSLIGPRELGSFWYLKLLYKITPEERDLPPASVLEGVLKAPLPRIGAPPPPDPLATLRGVVTGEPTEEHLALAKRVLAEADGEKLVALLVGAKVDEVAAAKAAVRAAAETARKEREEKERAERTERYGEGGDRPSFGRDRGDRPSFGRDRDRGGGGDRPRFGGDRDRGGDRPRFGGDRDRGDRPRHGRDRDGGGDRAVEAPAARLEGEAAPVAVVAERPRPERDGGDRPRFDRDGGFRPRYGRDRDGGGDRPRFDRDRGADAAPARVEGEAAPAVAERARPERDGGDRPRFDRDGGDRPRYGRDRDGGDRDARPSADARPAGDAPREARPERDGGDRPRYGRDRDGGDRDARPSADARPAGDAPREARPERDGGDRPRYGRDGGDRDARPSADARPAGDAPREARPERDGGDRPRYGRDRDGGDRDARPSGDRDRGDRDARPSGDRDARPSGDRDRGDRDARPSGDRDARPSGDRDRGDRDALPSGDRDRGDRDARPSSDRDRDARPSGDRDRDARPSGDRDRGDRDARPSGDRDRGDRDARPSGDRDARPSGDRDARPSGEARPDRSERDRFRDERAATFERAAERVEREERAAREARGEPAPEPVIADVGDRPAREGRDRGGRGGRDRDRDRDRPREASADRPAADAAAGRKNGAAPIDQRDFWETWADEKSSRSAEPAPSRDRDAAPSRDRDRDRDAAPSRDRDRDAAPSRDRDREPAPSRDRDREPAPSRDRDRDAAPSRDAAPAPSREAAPSDEVRAERPRDDEAPPRRERGGRGRDRKRDDDGPPRRERGSRDAEAAPAPAAATPAAIADPASQVRLHVNLGKKHGVTADDVRRLLGEDLGGDAASIGSVAMRDTYCHVRVPSSLAQPIIDAMSGKSHGETAIKVELART